MERTIPREIRGLVGELAERQAWLVDCRKEIDRQRRNILHLLDEIEGILQAIDWQTREIDELLQTTAPKYRETLLDMRRERDEACLALREIFLQLRETAQSVKKTELQVQEQWRELNRQVGGLGDQLGSYSEIFVVPAMAEVLTHRFQVDRLFRRVRVRRGGGTLELDMLAYPGPGSSHGEAVFVVKVESRLGEEALDRMQAILRDVHGFLPELAGRQVYGILAAVNASGEVGEKALREGIYLASIHDGQFEVQVPDGLPAPRF